MTRTTLQVLQSLIRPVGEHYGYEILKETGIKGGSLYPILERLEKEGWVTATWKESTNGRPRRRCYNLTGLGAREAKIALVDARGNLSPSLRPIGGSL